AATAICCAFACRPGAWALPGNRVERPLFFHAPDAANSASRRVRSELTNAPVFKGGLSSAVYLFTAAVRRARIWPTHPCPPEHDTLVHHDFQLAPSEALIVSRPELDPAFCSFLAGYAGRERGRTPPERYGMRGARPWACSRERLLLADGEGAVAAGLRRHQRDVPLDCRSGCRSGRACREGRQGMRCAAGPFRHAFDGRHTGSLLAGSQPAAQIGEGGDARPTERRVRNRRCLRKPAAISVDQRAGRHGTWDG